MARLCRETAGDDIQRSLVAMAHVSPVKRIIASCPHDYMVGQNITAFTTTTEEALTITTEQAIQKVRRGRLVKIGRVR